MQWCQNNLTSNDGTVNFMFYYQLVKKNHRTTYEVPGKHYRKGCPLFKCKASNMGGCLVFADYKLEERVQY